jgi:S1-C subfamily serine protease
MIKVDFLLIILLVSFSFSLYVGTSFGQFSNSSNQTYLDSRPVQINNSLGSPQLELSSNVTVPEIAKDQLSNHTLLNEGLQTLINSASKISNDSLPKLFESTINSVVDITSYDGINQSDFKIGTGFVADINGTLFLITSNSLVNTNDTATITLSTGDKYDSLLVGSDPVANLALLSMDNISKDKIVPLKVANSSSLQIGQMIATIDNVMGFSKLFTTGIISGLEKSIPTFGENVSNSLTKVPNGIITDLDSYSGGYGGSPLLNLDGNLVGMNVQNYSSESMEMNPISLAIPSNSIIKIAPELNAKGHYLHPWLGISGTDVTPDIAEVLRLDESRGFLVIAVDNQSPAKLSGILGGDNVTNINGVPITLGGDIILKVDDKNIRTIHDILSYVENEKNVGDNMVITVLRNGLLQSINIHLQANPSFLPITP